MPKCLRKDCGFWGATEKFPTALSAYHDLTCPKCGTTNLDVSDVRDEQEAAGEVYGFTDRNVLRAAISAEPDDCPTCGAFRARLAEVARMLRQGDIDITQDLADGFINPKRATTPEGGLGMGEMSVFDVMERENRNLRAQLAEAKTLLEISERARVEIAVALCGHASAGWISVTAAVCSQGVRLAEVEKALCIKHPGCHWYLTESECSISKCAAAPEGEPPGLCVECKHIMAPSYTDAIGACGLAKKVTARSNQVLGASQRCGWSEPKWESKTTTPDRE